MSSMSIDKDEDTDSTDIGNQTESNLAPKMDEIMNPSNAAQEQNTATPWKWGDDTDNNEDKKTENDDKQTANGNTSSSGLVWSFATNNDNAKATDNKVTFGVSNADPSPSAMNTDDKKDANNGDNGVSFGVPDTDESNTDTADKNVGFVFNPSNGDQAIVTFDTSNNAESTSNDTTNTITFGTSKSNPIDVPMDSHHDDDVKQNNNTITFGTSNNTNSNNNGVITFGAPNNDQNTNDNNNNPFKYTFGSTATDNASNINHDTANSTENNNNNNNISSTNNNFQFSFGVSSDHTANNNISSTSFAFTESKTSEDPFAAFNAKQKEEEEEEKEKKTEQEAAGPPPPPPAYDESLIDTEAMAAFLNRHRRDINNQWQCIPCGHYNTADALKCAACDVERGDAPLIVYDIEEEETKETEKKGHDYSYYDTLNKNDEILAYESFDNHPIPRYFPYQHEDKAEELDREPLETWTQFDETKKEEKEDGDEEESKENDQNDGKNDKMEQDDDGDDDDVKPEVIPKITDLKQVDSDRRVRVYREYKRRRNECREQISEFMAKRPKIKSTDIIDRETESIIAIAGDGSLPGQLGVGNGNITAIPSNVATFPFMMESKAPRKLQAKMMNIMRKVKLITAGIMSTAVVTYDDELYVWGLNDKSELTINPCNPDDVDVGDDDDKLSEQESWNRLYNHYHTRITNIYEEKNPSKLEAKPKFVKKLLDKWRVGELTIQCNGETNVVKPFYYANDGVIETQKDIWKQRCRAKDKKRRSWKNIPVTASFTTDFETTSESIFNNVYIKVCGQYNIDPEQIEKEPFIPEVTKQDMEDRRNRKLNPYKYLQQDDEDEDIDIEDTPGLTRQDSENVEMKDNDKDDDNDTDMDTVSSFVYEQKKDEWEEEDYQSTLSCSYYTPARVRLPHKMVIKQVTIGAAHMVVLDTLGRVYSSGTFKNETPVGHHWDSALEQITRYQRELKAITNIDSLSDARQSNRKNNNKLPPMDMIASGNDHFLMLDKKGDIWKMGVTKLGQRWCPRNVKNYLIPQRVSLIQNAKGRRTSRKTRFIKIACGSHHNLAISTNGHLFAWGQNIWGQCGVPKDQSAYGCVIDQPRFVNFYQNKQDLNDVNEENVAVDYTITDVVGGEHMTIALDSNNNVWSCGRNACQTLGRRTRWPGIQILNGQRVRSEVDPDVMRKIPDLKHIDWIGCGSVVWFAHSSSNGAVYAFGDAISGRAGIGKWQYARGRPVFDSHNFDTTKYKVVKCDGGSDHTIFLIKRKRRMHRRHSVITSISSSLSNSREASMESSLDETVTNGIHALDPNNIIHDENSNSSNTSNSSNGSRRNVPSTAMAANKRRVRRGRKRKRSDMEKIEENSKASSLDKIQEEEFDKMTNEPQKKRMKRNKPELNKEKARFKGDEKHDLGQSATTPVPGKKK